MKVIKPTSKEFEKIVSRFTRRRPQVAEKVRSIIEDVRSNSDEALCRLTRKFDRVSLSVKELKVSESETNGAYQNIDPNFVSNLKTAIENVEKFHRCQLKRSWKVLNSDGVMLGERVHPLDSVGIYIPGGTAPLISTIYMTVIPARLAGVKHIYLATPPNNHKSVNPHILVVANLLKVDAVFKMGGAQAIAAFAFGTKSVPKVDKVVGPGNAYVTEAKRQIFGYCDIDMLAGPTELVVIANDHVHPDFVAADLMAQSEHHGGLSILVTTSKRLAKAMRKLDIRGVTVRVKNLAQAAEIANQIASEHVQLMVKNPNKLLKLIRHAGAIFIGAYTPTAVGDYVAGPSHVLPTGGTARFFSGLGVSDFLKRSHVISYSRKALEEVRESVECLAGLEGLPKHLESVKIRFTVK